MLRPLFVTTLALVLLAACAPLQSRDVFTERRPDPVLDLAAHNAPVEWWYWNGHLEYADGSGSRGFAGAIFQVLLPTDAHFGWLPLQSLLPGGFYFGHFGLLDKERQRFETSEIGSRPQPGSASIVASASTERLDVRLGDWYYRREPDGSYRLKMALAGGRETLELTLLPARPEVVHGPGWSGSLESGRMYYNGNTRLRASGTLGGKRVVGQAWLDHQWGGGVGSGTDAGLGNGLGDGSASIRPRWDWFSLQLDDGRDLMIYQIHTAKGGIADAFISVNDGITTTEYRDFTLRPMRFATMPSGNRYPVAWSLRLGDTLLLIEPLADHQELNTPTTSGLYYYEGAMKVSGTSIGLGYMELTGYAPMKPSPLQNPFAHLEAITK
jgi:predicted secreted hydrolase